MDLTETCGGTWQGRQGCALGGWPLGRWLPAQLAGILTAVTVLRGGGKARLLPQPDLLKLIFIQVCLMEYVSKACERVCVCFLNPISGFGKLYLIIAKNFRTIFKVFSVSFDPDLMDGTHKPSVWL